jgi:hypothetical protein
MAYEMSLGLWLGLDFLKGKENEEDFVFGKASPKKSTREVR